MATDRSETNDEGEHGLFGLVAFVAVVSLFIFVNIKAGTRGMGVFMLVGALIQQVRGRISYGWEGRPASGYITGAFATGINLLFVALGLAIAIWPEVAISIFRWSEK